MPDRAPDAWIRPTGGISVGHGHVFLAISWGLGLIVFFYGVGMGFELSANMCANGCSSGDIAYRAATIASCIGALAIATAGLAKKWSWWPKIAGLLTLWLWIMGAPLMVYGIVLIGFSVP